MKQLHSWGGTAVFALHLLACSHSPQSSPPAGTEGGSGELPHATVVLHGGDGTVRVDVELARSSAERARGLMFRRSLPAEQGMLFLFDREEVQSFWMQNTYIPLDMIFINRRMQVAGIVENAAPLTTASRKVDAPSIYVLEVNAGFARRHGIGTGTRVSFEGVR